MLIYIPILGVSACVCVKVCVMKIECCSGLLQIEENIKSRPHFTYLFAFFFQMQVVTNYMQFE